MRWLTTISLRMRSLFHRRAADDELDAELRSHLERQISANVSAGMSQAEARRAAMREFGSVESLKEECRDARKTNYLHDFAQDLRYGLRMLRKSPGFTAVAVLTLALGIGADTALFSVVNAVIIRPLPYPNADRTVMIFLRTPALGIERGGYGVADFFALRQQQKSFESVAAFTTLDNGITLTGGQEPQAIPGIAVTAAFFDVLGVKPQLGRTFLPGEDQFGQPKVIVVGNRFWREHLAADSSAIGRTLTLNGANYTVVGVLPADFHFGPQDNSEVWPILQLRTPTARPPYFLRIAGRLKPGVSAAAAGADASRIAAAVTAQYPKSDKVTAVVTPLKEILVGGSRSALLVMLGAVAFVLLIAVVNVASLQLSRSAARQPEMAIRTALGAGWWRLTRQLLTESVLLSAVGGALGLALAYIGLRAIVVLSPGVVPRMDEIALDAPVLFYTLGVALFAGIAFGLAPAVRLHSPRMDESLKRSEKRSLESPVSRRLHNVLAVSEFSLALVLLIGAGLLVRSLWQLESVSPGFNPSHILTMKIPLPPARYQQASQVTSFYQRLLDGVAAMQGVEATGITMSLPPNLLKVSNPFHMEGQSYEPGKSTYLAEEIPVSPDYFRALGVPLISGRFFDDSDRAPDRHVLLINQTMARRYFAGRDAVGQRLQTGDADPKSYWCTIVGVVGDVKYEGLDAKEQPTMYVPYTNDGWSPGFVRSMFLVVRTTATPASIISTVRANVTQLDPSVPVIDMLTMDQLLSQSVSGPRFRTGLLGTFAALALVLAAIGIYGVLAYSVARRTHEIGIRMALGAQPRQVLRLILGQGVRLAVYGILIGIAVSLAVTRLLSSLLFGISATDPLTFAAVALLLTAVALAACYIPARRAMRVDPMVALRYE